MFKVNNRNTRTRWEICSKLKIKTPERRYWCRSGVFIVNFEHISPYSRVSLVNFEQVNETGKVIKKLMYISPPKKIFYEDVLS